ncbi:MAG TPA: ATP-binding cassette domain-containing protein [Gammaproteobacteria bacterium]
MTTNNVLISGRQLRPAFAGQSGLAGVTIDIKDSSIVGVIGPDAKFKSGWLKILAGIENIHQGELHIFGRNVAEMSKQEWQSMRVNLSYLNEETKLLSVLGTLENILMPSLYHKLGQRNELLLKAQGLLDEIEFENRDSLRSLPAYIDDYEYCQAIIVRALLMRPKILVIDNVFRKLEAEFADKLMAFIMQYVKNHGVALLFHVSKPDFVLEHANRILFVMHRFMLQFNDKQDVKVSGNEDLIKYLQDHYIS